MSRHDQVCRPMTPRRRPAPALLLATVLAGVPGMAMAQAMAPGAPAGAPAAVTPQPPTATVMQAPMSPGAAAAPSDNNGAAFQSKVGKEKAAKIETRIARLHAALRITPQQEPLWQNFAGVMRQNVVQLDAVYAKRENSYGGMNAVQDLQSYAEVQEVTARNVQMLLQPFEALYDSLSPDQRKAADATFQHNTNRALQKAG